MVSLLLLQMSGDLQWLLIRNSSSFLIKRKGVTFTKVSCRTCSPRMISQVKYEERPLGGRGRAWCWCAPIGCSSYFDPLSQLPSPCLFSSLEPMAAAGVASLVPSPTPSFSSLLSTVKRGGPGTFPHVSDVKGRKG